MSGDLWADLVSAALIGTDRRALPPTGADAVADPAVDLLERAAVQAVRVRAGRRPGRGRPLPAAPAEERPLVPPAAADRLARILGGQQSRLLPEWLELAAARGWRLPAHLLPPVLTQATKDHSIRGRVAALAGRRGRWLAEHIDDRFSFLLREAREPGEQTWQFGTLGDRRNMLRELRESDPAAGRELLAGTWEQEPPGDRATLLKELATGLSDDDEPFLEAALDTRGREVRQEAADLLARLPGSRLAARMTARGRGCLAVRGGAIEVTPPNECDDAAQRDGVRPNPPRGTGQRMWWLQQIIARTPLSLWADEFGAPHREIVRMKIVDWEREVVAGWIRAAVLQRDAAWARALFARDPMADLLSVLPPSERDAVTIEFLRVRPVDNKMIMVICGLNGPWGAKLTTAVLNKIVSDPGVEVWNVQELTKRLGEHGDPSLYPAAERASDHPDVQAAAAVLRFRHDMTKELS